MRVCARAIDIGGQGIHAPDVGPLRRYSRGKNHKCVVDYGIYWEQTGEEERVLTEFVALESVLGGIGGDLGERRVSGKVGHGSSVSGVGIGGGVLSARC